MKAFIVLAVCLALTLARPRGHGQGKRQFLERQINGGGQIVPERPTIAPIPDPAERPQILPFPIPETGGPDPPELERPQILPFPIPGFQDSAFFVDPIPESGGPQIIDPPRPAPIPESWLRPMPISPDMPSRLIGSWWPSFLDNPSFHIDPPIAISCDFGLSPWMSWSPPIAISCDFGLSPWMSWSPPIFISCDFGLPSWMSSWVPPMPTSCDFGLGSWMNWSPSMPSCSDPPPVIDPPRPAPIPESWLRPISPMVMDKPEWVNQMDAEGTDDYLMKHAPGLMAPCDPSMDDRDYEVCIEEMLRTADIAEIDALNHIADLMRMARMMYKK